MSTAVRIHRFLRLREIDVRKLDEIGARMAGCVQQLQQLQNQLARQEAERQESLMASSEASPQTRLQWGIWLKHSLQESAAIRDALRAEQQRWTELNAARTLQQQRTEAWDRLIERLRRRQAEIERHQEMRLADELAIQKAFREIHGESATDSE